MTYRIDFTVQAERSEYLQAEHYQHTPERIGHANGYKAKTLRTRIGDITFAVPQVREGGFFSNEWLDFDFFKARCRDIFHRAFDLEFLLCQRKKATS